MAYEIRRFESSEKREFLELFNEVFEEERSTEWFDWKYVQNPFVDHIPIVVATKDDEIVGARSFFPLFMVVNGDRKISFQPCDTMVHPADRNQGLFTRMTEYAIECYSDLATFFFNFPNHNSLPGNLKLGWEIVGEQSLYYRVDDPGKVARAKTDSTALHIAGSLAKPVVRGYYRLKRLRSSTSHVYSVKKEDLIPTSELVMLYRESIPEEIHSARTATFYNWRFDNPMWDYTTYIAKDDAGPVAGIIVGSTVGDGLRKTAITDVVPLEAAPKQALATLFDQIFRDFSETDIYSAPNQLLPESVLHTFGFRSVDSFPYSHFQTHTTQVVRSFSDNHIYNEMNVTKFDNWLVSFVDKDVY